MNKKKGKIRWTMVFKHDSKYKEYSVDLFTSESDRESTFKMIRENNLNRGKK